MNKTYIVYILFSILYLILILICILVRVAFFTLFERKVLGYIHKRKGPNKSSILGLTQPFADALKLLSKEFIISTKIRYSIYIFSPIIIIILTLILWSVFPTKYIIWNFNQNILFILCCLSISVYPILLGGWSSNSRYALIGSIRGLAQTISYEVSLSLILISCLTLFETLNFYSFKNLSSQLRFTLLPLIIIIFISSLAEVNRTPFDFVEGESELVSGYNIEYYGRGFTLIFLAEYSIIIWIRGFNSILFFYNFNFIIITLIISFLFIWIRGTFPRIRYDELIYICWKIFLPIRILILIILTIFKFKLINNIY